MKKNTIIATEESLARFLKEADPMQTKNIITFLEIMGETIGKGFRLGSFIDPQGAKHLAITKEATDTTSEKAAFVYPGTQMDICETLPTIMKNVYLESVDIAILVTNGKTLHAKFAISLLEETPEKYEKYFQKMRAGIEQAIINFNKE
ncbi:hypothetical protein K8R66_01005 [bacterium]|nr:hypothetical protein [bacterium]